jgi:hypothetical protein
MCKGSYSRTCIINSDCYCIKLVNKSFSTVSKEQLELREQRIIEMWQSEKNKSEIGRILGKEGLGAKGGYEPLHAKEVSKILEKNNLN